MEQIRVFLGNIQKKHGSVNSGLLFLLVLRGTVRVRSSERQQTLSQRDLMVINHGEFYSLESGEPNVTVWLSMGEEYLERVCREALYTRFSCVSTSENAATGPLYDSMRSQILQIAMHSYGRERDYELLIQSAAPPSSPYPADPVRQRQQPEEIQNRKRPSAPGTGGHGGELW